MACGPREYKTNSRTLRAMVSLEGPLPFKGWDYKVAASHAESETKSVLGSGYYYRGTLNNGAPDPLAPIAPGATTPGLVGLINSGILNPFSLTQTDAALAGLNAISACGTTVLPSRSLRWFMGPRSQNIGGKGRWPRSSVIQRVSVKLSMPCRPPNRP
mgnify:CR=1 FL=1